MANIDKICIINILINVMTLLIQMCDVPNQKHRCVEL